MFASRNCSPSLFSNIETKAPLFYAIHNSLNVSFVPEHTFLPAFFISTPLTQVTDYPFDLYLNSSSYLPFAASSINNLFIGLDQYSLSPHILITAWLLIPLYILYVLLFYSTTHLSKLFHLQLILIHQPAIL